MPATNMLFETDRLVVRGCCIKDAAALTGLMTPQISRWVAAWPDPLSLEDAKQIITANIDAREAGTAVPCVIVERASGAVVGWLKIEFSDAAQTLAELGYWIGEDFQRKGYAFEVATGALAFAFSNPRVEVVRAGAQLTNEASQRLLAKLGMTVEGKWDVWASARQRFEQCAFWHLSAAEFGDL